MRTSLLLLLAVAVAVPAVAQDNPTDATTDAASVVKDLGGGTADVGGVKVDKASSSIRFPAAINMRKGFVEYLIVGENGKTHESTLVTQASPQFVHIAMLLLGAKGNPKKAAEPAPANIDAAYLTKAPPIAGDVIRIEIEWSEDGRTKKVPVEDFLALGEDLKPVKPGTWTYNGSMVVDGRFIATDDQSFVSLITDPGALMNNPRPERTKDDAWQSNTAKIPPEGTKVTVIVTLVKDAGKTAES